VPAREHTFQEGHLFKESPSHYIAVPPEWGRWPLCTATKWRRNIILELVSPSPSQNGNTDLSLLAPPVSGMDTLLLASNVWMLESAVLVYLCGLGTRCRFFLVFICCLAKKAIGNMLPWVWNWIIY
jgi:hypothetical protein